MSDESWPDALDADAISKYVSWDFSVLNFCTEDLYEAATKSLILFNYHNTFSVPAAAWRRYISEIEKAESVQTFGRKVGLLNTDIIFSVLCCIVLDS